MTTVQHRGPELRARIVGQVPLGVLAGLAGGLPFGAIMAAEGMLPMVAELVGASTVAVGWVVHLVIAAGIGALFALLVPGARLLPLVGAGLVYGVAWWVLGALTLMPARLGGELFAVDAGARTSLVGHLVFGLVAGGVLALLRRRGGR